MPVESADRTQGKTIIDSQPGYLTYHPSPALNAAAPFRDLLAHLAAASCITPLALITGQHFGNNCQFEFSPIWRKPADAPGKSAISSFSHYGKSDFAGSATFGFCQNGSNPQTCLCAVH